MWNYEKRLQYPINIKTPNAKIAQFIASQYGGPDGEIGASLRYLSQRFTMPNRMTAAVLNDIGTEELLTWKWYPPLSISLHEIFLWKKLKKADSVLTISTMV